MNLDRLAGRPSVAGDDGTIRESITRTQFHGLAAVLVGVGQLPLAFVLADLSDEYLSLFVIGSGGWLLIAIGINLLSGKEAFYNGWTDNERIEWFMAAGLFLLAIVVVVASGLALLSMNR